MFPVSLLRSSWFLAGPTASGKSAAGIVLSQILNAEIISLDSMAIYRGMDIGTAKPSQEEFQKIPHHLIDVADPHEEFSIAQFLKIAATAASDILSRNKIPLFVGGTGLYLRTILRGFAEGPDADWNFRVKMETLAKQNGKDWLYSQLMDRDPESAARLHPHDMRRIIRALEVHHLTGVPLSKLQCHGPRPETDRPRLAVWLAPERSRLHDRINRRVDDMMAAGWLDETRELINRTPPPSRTACQALGYRELSSFLRSSATPGMSTNLEDTVTQIKTATRQFAKRQYTWFRNLEECRAIPVEASDSPESLATKILQLAD